MKLSTTCMYCHYRAHLNCVLLSNFYKNIVDNTFCYSYFHLIIFDDKNKTIILSKQDCNTNTCTCIFINTNMFMHMCICTHFTTSHYVYTYGHTQVHYCTYTFIYPDIDECSDDVCTQTCTNTNGSFTCGCNRGYLLDIDGFTCNGM